MVNKSDPILITGATGFIGSYIARWFIKNGYTNIHAIKRETSKMDLLGKDHDKIHWVDCDLLDIIKLEEVIKNVKVIVHAAAKVSFHESENHEMNLTNIKGTSHLVNLALDNEIQKFIHISSVAALGKSLKGEAITEETEWVESKYNSPYARSKKAAELEVWRAHAEGLNVSILNPSIVFGAGFWDQSSVKIFGNMHRGQKLYPKGSNGFVDVRDVAAAALMLLEKDFNGERFLLNGANLSFRSMMNEIAAVYQIAPPKHAIKDWVLPFSWRIMGLYSRIFNKPTVYTRSTVESSSKDWVYDASKSKEILDLNYTDIFETIRSIANEFLISKEQSKSFGILNWNR